MPFMKGAAPIRRTVDYLNKGQIHLRKSVEVLTINYNVVSQKSKKDPLHYVGIKRFMFWHLPQIQYKNPKVQILTFCNITPTPFITCYLNNGEKVLIDVFAMTQEQIHDRVLKILGKPMEALAAEKVKKKNHPSKIGDDCRYQCICEIPGQIPCSGLIQLPKKYLAKAIRSTDDE